MSNPPNIPGFFFDTEKEKYFPIQMKAAYDAEQKRKSEEFEKMKISNKKVALTVNDLLEVWPSPPVEFDSVLQRIERMMICEISWSGTIKIDADEGIYYRYIYEQGSYTVQHVIPSHTECEQVIKEFKHSYPDPVLDFGVVCVNPDYKIGKEYLYWFVKGERVSKSSGECSEFEENLDIFLPVRNDIGPSHIKVCTSVIQDSHGYNVIVANSEDSLIFRGEHRGRQGIFTRFFDGKHHERFNVQKNIDFICYVPNLGEARIFVGGVIQIHDPNILSTGLKLKSSSATWLHYHSHNLYALTYHGDLVRFDLRQSSNQMELFNVKDLSQLPWSLFKFQDLLIEATKAVLLIGFRGGNEILVINLNNPTKVVKKITLQNKIESFKLSSNYSILYIHINRNV